MRFLKFNLIITGVIVLVTLFSFSILNKKGTENMDTQNWINVDYVKCLQKKLPCECEKITETYFYITLDTNRNSKFYGAMGLRYSENEFEQWDIERKTDGTYKVYIQLEDTVSIIGTLLLKENTLCFFDKKNKKSTFKKYGNAQYLKQNVLLLNKAFMKRGYSLLEKTFNEDSLNCSCNKELGIINLVTVNGSDKSWILEQENDSVFIYDFTNSSDGKTVPPRINKKLLKKYKW